MIYIYRCSRCRALIEAVRPVAERHNSPLHCEIQTVLEIQPSLIYDSFEPYKAIGGDRRYIKNKREHRDFLKEFGYEEVGNDPAYAPPSLSEDEQAYNDALAKAEIERSFAETDQLSRDLAVNPGE